MRDLANDANAYVNELANDVPSIANVSSVNALNADAVSANANVSSTSANGSNASAALYAYEHANASLNTSNSNHSLKHCSVTLINNT